MKRYTNGNWQSFCGRLISKREMVAVMVEDVTCSQCLKALLKRYAFFDQKIMAIKNQLSVVDFKKDFKEIIK